MAPRASPRRATTEVIDAHCHLDLPPLSDDVDAALARAHALGVSDFVVAGVDEAGWARQAALAARHPSVHVCYGLHPWAVADMDDAHLSAGIDALMETLEASGEGDAQPVALGELGLDRGPRVAKDSLPRQRRAFRVQLAIARERELPVVLHLVRSHGLALEILKADGLPEAGGMVHAYGGSVESARAYVGLGLHLSFSTAICRPQARRLRKACAAVPAERLLVETDAPDQSPQADGQGVNEPANLPQAIRALAEARGTTPDAIAALTRANAERLFGL